MGDTAGFSLNDGYRIMNDADNPGSGTGSTGFLMPAGPGESSLTEKRSRFLGHLIPVESETEAREYITRIKKQYHDARHNCWCYRLDGGTERFSDDGEPQGSAGMPMLEVFRREEIFRFVCVVTRYFGGVLLGTGGLSRAYSGAAKDALTAAGTVFVGRFRELSFSCPYGLADRIRSRVDMSGAAVADVRYGSEVEMTVRVPEETAETLAGEIRELSGGRVTVRLHNSRADF